MCVLIDSLIKKTVLMPTVSSQCTKEVAQLHLPLRKLGIGTYVADPKHAPEGSLPFWPLATATMTTPVFDVVHSFSERGISAVPIIDEDGIVVNLYETVDVIVRRLSSKRHSTCLPCVLVLPVLFCRLWCGWGPTSPLI